MIKRDSENLGGAVTSNIARITELTKGVFYGFTIKPMFVSMRKSIGNDQDLFESWYQNYCKTNDLIPIKHRYERDSYNVLHIHAKICVPRIIEYKVYNKELEVKGFSVWIVKQRNQRWEHYIDKEIDNTNARQYYTKHYGFVLDFN